MRGSTNATNYPTITVDNSSNVSLIGGPQSKLSVTVPRRGMYLVHIWGATTIGQEGWSQVGISKGGNAYMTLQNLYYQGAGLYYHSVIGLEKFNAGDIINIYRYCSTAMTENMSISITYLGNF